MSTIQNIENKEKGLSVRGKLNGVIAAVNGLGTAANVDTGTVEGNVPVLIADGKLPDSTIPSLAITETYEVADDVGRDALGNIEEGDVAIVEASAEADGLSASYIWTGTEWVKLRFPKDPRIHDQNADTKLADSTANEVSASELRTHVDDSGKHRQINDAGVAATDLWSADKIGTDLGGKVDTEEGKGLSDENYTSAEKSKLAGLESSKFLGQYASLSALNTAHPDPATGSYAYVDEGVNSDVVKYIWDDSDNAFVLQLGEATEETPATIKQKYEENADTNAYTDTEQAKVANVPADTNTELGNKVDKVTGKGLSENDYTDADVAKVANVPADTNTELAKKANRKTTIGRTVTESGDLANGDIDTFVIVDSVTEVTLSIPAAFMAKGESATFYQAGAGNIKLTNTDGEAVTSGEGQSVTLLCIKDDPETYLTTGDAVWSGY